MSSVSTNRQLVETEHSALFPILIVLRNLRATEDGRGIQASLRPLVMSNLLSRDWQVSCAAIVAKQAGTRSCKPGRFQYGLTR